MNTRTTTTTTNARTIVSEIAESATDFVLGALPTLAALGGILALFLVPLFLLARGLGVC